MRQQDIVDWVSQSKAQCAFLRAVSREAVIVCEIASVEVVIDCEIASVEASWTREIIWVSESLTVYTVPWTGADGDDFDQHGLRPVGMDCKTRMSI